MFIVNDQMNGLPREASLISILHSVNEPMIAAADHPAEATRAYICLVSNGKNRLESHIIFYLPQSKMRVMYTWEEGAFEPDGKSQVEEEALDFVENMGFMMDNTNLQKLSGNKRESLLSELPIFSGDEPTRETLPLEDLDELDILGTEGAPKTAVVSPGDLDDIGFPPEASKSVSLSEVESFKLMEEEFSRDTSDLDEALDSAISSIAPNESMARSKPSPAKDAKSKLEPDQLEAWVRLMASF